MSDQELIDSLMFKIEEADLLMRESCAGGLQYGWDWPTFNTLFPEQAAAIRELRAEGRRRGLDKTPA